MLPDSINPYEENIHILLMYKEYFSKLLELKTKIIRNLESNIGFAEMADDIELSELQDSILDLQETIERIVHSLIDDGIMIPLVILRKEFNLNHIELNIMLMALMPHIDTGFRMKIARYKDNILFNYVDVDLIINTFFETPEESIDALAYFYHNSNLITNRLIRLFLHTDLTSDELINYEVKLPERLVNFLLMKNVLGTSLTPFCELKESKTKIDEIFLPVEDKQRILNIVSSNQSKNNSGLILLFSGLSGTGKTDFSEGIASYTGKRFMTVNCSKLLQQSSEPEVLIQDLFYEAMLHNAVLVFKNASALLGSKNFFIPNIIDMLDRFNGIVIFTVDKIETMDVQIRRRIMFEMSFEKPGSDIRAMIWKKFLLPQFHLDKNVNIKIVAHQYDFPGGHIKNAVKMAVQRALTRNFENPVITMDDLDIASQAQLRGDLTEYSQKTNINLTLNDLILPDKEMHQVVELLAACRNHQKVLTMWGFNKKLTTGKGIVALFTGEPGTGKTLCAEILSNELEMQLFQISIPKIVSKWIGETEKNIASIFSKARSTHAVLLFDEADALFTNRVSVKSSTDRYSNLETNFLLQEIERYEGIVILTTNRVKDFDKAYKRRILFQIHFPMPERKEREAIWRHLMPPEMPLAEDIDFNTLARNFEYPGGNIKNVLLRAAYKAMNRNSDLTMDILFESGAEESRSSGMLFRRPTEDDF